MRLIWILEKLNFKISPSMSPEPPIPPILLYSRLWRSILWPVHNNADLKVYGFVLPRTHQLIRVRTTVFIAFPTVHNNTPRIRCEGILKFFFHSSAGTTVCETKLSHHALVRPGPIQNLLALASRVFEPNRRYEVLVKAISRISLRIVLLLWETNKRLKRARFNSKQAMKNRSKFCSDMFVLIFGLGVRACYSTTCMVQLMSSFQFLSGSDRPH